MQDQDYIALRQTAVGKMNVGTALRQAFGTSLREQVQNNPMVYDRLELLRQPSIEVEAAAYQILQRHQVG